MSIDTLVIIPTYNEIENIAPIIHAVFGLKTAFDVLIVDDDSQDGTGEAVKSLQKQYGNLFLLERKTNRGLGRAYCAGFKWALERHYHYVMQMDADFSHNPHDLLRLRAACGPASPFIIGSRYIEGKKVENWPWKRVLISICASIYVNFVLGMNIKDTTSGFTCMASRVLKKIQIDKIESEGYCFQIELKYRIKRKKIPIKELSIVFINRKKGKSKMSANIFNEALVKILRLRFLSWFGKL